MTTKLTIFNGALLVAKERFLSSLTENSEPRRLLDYVWDNGGVRACLEEGQWNFAMRTVQVDYDPTIEPDFGSARAFSKPSDWVRTVALCQDGHFRAPLTQYTDEAGYWYADQDTIYLRYVSDDANYGTDYNAWPKSFEDFVHAHFASKIIGKLQGADTERIKEVETKRKKALLEAKNKCAMTGPAQFTAPGSWSMARMRGANRRDGGSRSEF